MILYFVMLSFLLTASVSMANTLPFPKIIEPKITEGIFVFQGNWELTFQKKIVSLPLQSADTEYRKLELEGQGYSCFEGVSFVYCSLSVKNPQVTSRLQKTVLSHYQGVYLKFYPYFGKSSLYYNSQFQKNWEVEQKLTIGPLVFFPLDYEWNQGQNFLNIEMGNLIRRFKINSDSLTEFRMITFKDQGSEEQNFIDIEFKLDSPSRP